MDRIVNRAVTSTQLPPRVRQPPSSSRFFPLLSPCLADLIMPSQASEKRSISPSKSSTTASPKKAKKEAKEPPAGVKDIRNFVRFLSPSSPAYNTWNSWLTGSSDPEASREW